MAYQFASSSSSSIRRPYMGDNEGTYHTTTATKSRNVYTTSAQWSTYAVGAAYETYSYPTDYDNANVVSASISPSPSPWASPSPDTSNSSEYNDLSAYLASIETVNGTAVATGTADDQNAASSATETVSNNNTSPLKIAAIGIPAAVGLIIVIVGVWLCCRCTRRRRLKDGGNRGPEPGRGYGEMRQVGQTQDNWRFSVPSLPHIRDQGYGGEHAVSRNMITRNEVLGIVTGSPSRRSRSNGSYSPSPSYHYSQPEFPLPGRYSHAPSSRDSRWADGSEMDAMAEDGSTITRTLSTTSTRRSIMTADGLANGENPFDHPAYTYRTARPRPPGTFTRGPTSAITDTSGSSSSFPNSSLQSTLSPISPITPASLHPGPAHAQSISDTYSIHSSDDGTFGLPAARPGLRREPTIIRHADSFGAPNSGYATKVEREGRDGIVELPPLYEDATASWSRR